VSGSHNDSISALLAEIQRDYGRPRGDIGSPFDGSYCNGSRKISSVPEL
jgi:hypothetical protein